jgi:15-cis-phytoene synthase
MNVADSYRFCQKMAKGTAKNFYYSFMGLPPAQFRAMCVLYSYMRTCDDIGDDESVSLETRRELLIQWKKITLETFDSTASDQSSSILATPKASSEIWNNGLCVLPALRDMVAQYEIPHQYFFDVIEGVCRDLWAADEDAVLTARHQTFDELSGYCYHVAGVVGLCCIHIWGIEDDRALERAVDCGKAFQLTNILRDLAEDAASGRLYLPNEDLEKFGYSPSDLQQHKMNDQFLSLMQFQANRAQSYYDQAQELFDFISPTGRPILAAMIKIYRGLLNEIVRRDYDVFSKRISLPTWRKLIIAADAVIRRRFIRKAS